MRLAPGLVILALLGGCGSEDGEPARTAPPPASRDAALEIRFDDGEGQVREASLRCGAESEAGGYLEDADAPALCRASLALGPLLTEQPPVRACTQIFGGPQSARVTGELDGERVRRRFSRENGCRIAEWDRLAAAGLVPGA